MTLALLLYKNTEKAMICRLLLSIERIGLVLFWAFSHKTLECLTEMRVILKACQRCRLAWRVLSRGQQFFCDVYSHGYEILMDRRSVFALEHAIEIYRGKMKMRRESFVFDTFCAILTNILRDS